MSDSQWANPMPKKVVVPAAKATEGGAFNRSASAVARSDDFWANNPQGVTVDALFGGQGGAGEIGQAIKRMDVNGDGYLNREEFRSGVSNALKTLQDNKNLKRIAMLMGGLLIITIFAMFGLTFAVVELSKETATGTDGVMKVAGTETHVKVDNTDMTTAGAKMKTRDTNKTLEVAQSTDEGTLHSNLPDSFFEELRFFRTETTNARLVVQVQGFIRAKNNDVSTVTLITPIGEISLMGTALTFKLTTTSDHFKEAGFSTDGRRLLSLYKLVGLFNNIENWEGDVPADVAKPNFPAKFEAKYEIYYKCAMDHKGSDEPHDRCADERPAAPTVTNIDDEGANARFVKTVTGTLYYDNKKAIEIKEMHLSGTPGYRIGKFYDPNRATGPSGSWFFDPTQAGSLGFNPDVPAYTLTTIDGVKPAVAFCELSKDNSQVDLGEMMAKHFTGLAAGEKMVPAGVEGIGGQTLMRWKLMGDSSVGHMEFIVHSETSGTIRRITLRQNGETAVYVFKTFSESLSIDVISTLARGKDGMGLPPGCHGFYDSTDDGQNSINKPASLDMVTHDNPLSGGAGGDEREMKRIRMLMEAHGDELREVATYNNHIRRRRQLLGERRKLASAKKIFDVVIKLLQKINDKDFFSGGGQLPSYDQAGFPSYCQPDITKGGYLQAWMLSKKFGLALGFVTTSYGRVPCSIAVSFSAPFPVPNIVELGGSISVFVGWETMEFEVVGCIDLTLFSFWTVLELCVFAGNCQKKNNPCTNVNACNSGSDTDRTWYWGLSGEVNIIFAWANLYYNHYFPAEKVGLTQAVNQFKWYVSAGINLGFISIGGVVAGNSDDPHIWLSGENGDDEKSKPKDASEGLRALGATCGKNKECVTRQCCWCKYADHWACDTESDWADDCDGEWAKRRGGCF